jgi:tetratricopeptide (TPR) repeat protein
MKKFIFASALALAVSAFVVSPVLRAQDISIKDQAEFNAYQNAASQSDPKAKAAAYEQFLTQYPQTVAKQSVLNELVGIYWGLQDADHTLSAASRVLQVDPSNAQAILYSVIIKKGQCAKTSDAQTCDDAAALAQKGLTLTKPASMSDADWQKVQHVGGPYFHSTIALDDVISKKDYKGAQAEYTAELKLDTDDESKSSGLNDTLLLAQAYSQPGSGQDLKEAIWFYARVWAFAPAQYKAQIEPKLEYFYKKFHGGLDGLDAIKQQAAASVFPPGTINITPAKSPAEQIHDLVASTPDLNTLALEDKETILALGSKTVTNPDGTVVTGDADKMWAVLKDKNTGIPGVVIAVTANQVKLAVTQDAKDSKLADFIINLKTPLTDAQLKLYPVGFEFKAAPEAEIAGTFDSYTQVAATDTTSAGAQIIMREGEIIPAEKKKAPVHKPSPAHHN